MSVTAIVILLVIIGVIILGSVLKVNYGLLGMAAAFICGISLLGMSAGAVVGTWGVKLFFQLFSITFFYAFAVQNQTLHAIAGKVVYRLRGAAFLMPVILFLLSAVIAGIGPGTISTFLIMTPVVMQVAKESRMRPELAAIALCCGANAGAWDRIASNGITVRGIIESCGYTAEEAAAFSEILFKDMAIVCLVFFVLGYIFYKGWSCKTIEGARKPNPFKKEQKKTLALIMIFTVLVILPSVLKVYMNNAFVKQLSSLTDPTFLAILFGVLSILLKTGHEKIAISGVPWGTILNVCGMGMLIAVAVEAGTMDSLSEFIGRSFPASILPYLMGLVAAAMSLFSSTMGVVVPTLYPIIAAVAALSGASPALLFAIVPICAISAGNSPLSLFGGLVQASLDDESKRQQMFLKLIGIAVTMTIFSLIMAFLVLRRIS